MTSDFVWSMRILVGDSVFEDATIIEEVATALRGKRP